MARLNPEQQHVLRKIKRVGRRVGATPKEIKAAIETGLVESNLRNLPGGDADSAGWRQERASLYKDPQNLGASVRRFYKETAAVRDKYGSSGALAAAVQRPAAQYRGRYAQRAGEASRLLGRNVGGGDDEDDGGSSTTTTTRTPGVDNRQARAQLISTFLSDRDADPVDFAIQAKGLRDVAPTSRTSTVRTGGGGRGGGGGVLAGSAAKRADVINQQRLPYSWGGGHAGKTPLRKAVPLDCSGAVSKVLGIDPRVSGQFSAWGKAGDGGNRGVTVYSNNHHVLMKINGHFFGTSALNPGGGAGWIPQGQISKDYLRGFTARHQKG